MPSWNDLLSCLQEQEDPQWLDKKLYEYLEALSKRRGDSTVIFYASAFLQKADSSASTIGREDINGFMNALYNAPTDKGLTLILHTPGGDPNAVESIVEYLHSKFDRMEVFVPYLAMSGGAMISLASDLLVLGKQSQLGPIDPQFLTEGTSYSARAIQEAFAKARDDIEQDIRLAHLWAPILQNMGPSLVLEAEKALAYSKELVVRWLIKRMLKDEDLGVRREKANVIAAYFNAEPTDEHGQVHVHGQRIGAEQLQKLGTKTRVARRRPRIAKRCPDNLSPNDANLRNDIFSKIHCQQ